MTCGPCGDSPALLHDMMPYVLDEDRDVRGEPLIGGIERRTGGVRDRLTRRVACGGTPRSAADSSIAIPGRPRPRANPSQHAADRYLRRANTMTTMITMMTTVPIPIYMPNSSTFGRLTIP